MTRSRSTEEIKVLLVRVSNLFFFRYHLPDASPKQEFICCNISHSLRPNRRHLISEIQTALVLDFYFLTWWVKARRDLDEREQVLASEREALVADAQKRARDTSISEKRALDSELSLLRDEKSRLEQANREIGHRSIQVGVFFAVLAGFFWKITSNNDGSKTLVFHTVSAVLHVRGLRHSVDSFAN